MQKIFWIILSITASNQAISLSQAEIQRIGQAIWNNECKRDVNKLISWNPGEEFPSLGIGYFIWHTKSEKVPFAQQFPELISYLKKHHVKVPFWASMKYAPWENREAFLADRDSKRMKELQKLLESTIDLQAQFIVHRFQTQSLPAMLELSNPKEQQIIKKQLQRLYATPGGTYAVIDYVDFKGDGTSSQERYNNVGWGLLQVLLNMKESHVALQDFVTSAQELLKIRVENSPKERNEQKFLLGWHNRVKSYLTVK